MRRIDFRRGFDSELDVSDRMSLERSALGWKQAPIIVWQSQFDTTGQSHGSLRIEQNFKDAAWVPRCACRIRNRIYASQPKSNRWRNNKAQWGKCLLTTEEGSTAVARHRHIARYQQPWKH